MLFVSPLWLVALLPATGVVLWLLWGRRKRTKVPFLNLWRGPALVKPPRRGLQRPPVSVVFAIIALLLALLAAGKPAWKSRGGFAGQPITVIVDGGATMWASAGGIRRTDLAAKKAAEALATRLPADTPVDLITLPGSGVRRIELGQMAGTVAGLSPTAVDTAGALGGTVRERLQSGAGLVVVVSDRMVDAGNGRVIQFSPEAPIENVAIALLAARSSPISEVMLRLRNDSARSSIALTVKSADAVVKKEVALPERGQQKDYFVDLPGLGPVVQAALEGHDDRPADDQAWLVREEGSAKIEARGALSPEVRRMIDVYTRSRPPGEDAPVVPVVTTLADLPGEGPAVVVAPAAGNPIHGEWAVAADPITANVNWQALVADVQSSGEAPRGWTPLVSVGDRAIVARSAEPDRRVWVGFSSPVWASSTDFVVFWANVFSTVGQGPQWYVSHPLKEFSGGWKPIEWPLAAPAPQPGLWPGLYQSAEGKLRAFAPDDVKIELSAATTSDWPTRLASMTQPGLGAYDGTSIVLVCAVISLALAAWTWKRPALTPVSAARTF